MNKKGNSRSKSKGKDDKKSSRPPSGYLLFGNHEREQLKKTHSELKGKEVMTKIGENWGKLSEKEKAKWNDKAADEKARMIKSGEYVEKEKSSKSKDKDSSRGRSNSKASKESGSKSKGKKKDASKPKSDKDKKGGKKKTGKSTADSDDE